jgi:4-amino-4-deoxy-L-arabinose transferase-like glycosyltransferase
LLNATAGRWLTAILLLLMLWATRLPALDALPLHNDEGLHLRRALEVWNGHPFWDISDGKIINHWLIAAFYPQSAPVFAGRVATLFTSLAGLAAGYALAWRVAGLWGGLLAGALWLGSPYLFFFERLALSDAQAGSLVTLALWLALLVAHSGRWRLRAGLALGAAALFKFTAVPFALMLTLVVGLLGRGTVRQRVASLLWMALAAALCFAPPLAYLALRGRDFFGVALGWLGGSAGDQPVISANLSRLAEQLTGFGTTAWALLLLVGLALLLVFGRRDGRALLLAALLPLAVMIALGREVLPRHYVAALPVLLALAGCGFGLLINWLAEPRERWTLAGVALALLAFSIIPFMRTAYHDPAALPLPAAVRTQYITDHSAGYGLREAVQALPVIIEPGVPIIASLFPDSCRRANFYAQPGFALVCVNAPGLPEITQALGESGVVYVLVDNAPLIGLDVTLVDALAQQVAVFPRPAEDAASASVVLWRLSHR